MNIIEWYFKEQTGAGSFEKALFEAWQLAGISGSRRIENAFPEKFPKDKMKVNGKSFVVFPNYKSWEKEFKKCKFTITHLTENDIATLIDWGYNPEDMKQLQDCANTCKLTHSDGIRERAISAKTAIDKLGREVWLSGISRSAFHRSACRDNDSNNYEVYFEYK